MNSFINEVHAHKLYLYRAYCHGKKYLSGGKVIVVACPTDVFLYDENKILVSSIEDDLVTKCNAEVLAYVADGVKVFAVPSDLNYNIKILATDDGKMNYSVSEYDSEMNYSQTALFSELRIHKGASYTGSINEDYCDTPKDYSLVDDNGEMIGEGELITEENNLLVTDIKVTGIPDKLSIGKRAYPKFGVIPEDATVKSVVWKSSDDNIATVTEDGCIIALSEGKVNISVISIYGGVSKMFSIEVEGKDLSKPTIPDDPTAVPDVTSKPTIAPTVSDKPVATPVVTSKPIASIIPDKPIATPIVTGKPSETPAISSSLPNSTNQPIYTEETIWSWLPVSTPMPMPQQTLKPVQTSQPVSAAPDYTSKPITTEHVPSIDTTMTPSITHEPSSTLAPEVAESEKPCSTYTPSDDSIGSSEDITGRSAVDLYKDKKTKAYYRIVSKKDRTAAYVRPINKRLKTVKIATKVKIRGKRYKVTQVSDGAFKGCKRLHIVRLGNNIKFVGKRAFKNCKKLGTIKLNKKLITIKADAFNNCIGLKQIKLPSRLKKIGIRAFSDCKKLGKLQILTDKLNYTNVGANAFKGIAKYAWVQCHAKKWVYYQKLFESRGMTKSTIFNINL